LVVDSIFLGFAEVKLVLLVLVLIVSGLEGNRTRGDDHNIPYIRTMEHTKVPVDAPLVPVELVVFVPLDNLVFGVRHMIAVDVRDRILVVDIVVVEDLINGMAVVVIVVVDNFLVC
jgi:hypothetical protein